MKFALSLLLLGLLGGWGAEGRRCNREWYDDTDHGGDCQGHNDVTYDDVTYRRNDDVTGDCAEELAACNRELKGLERLENEVVRLSVQKGRLQARLRDVECKVAASKERQAKLRDQVAALVARDNEARARAGRLGVDRDRDLCLLNKFDETAGKCIKQGALANLTRIGDGIYYFFNDFSQGKTLGESFLFCTNYGMRLIQIETSAENDLIKARVQQLLAQDPSPLPNVDPGDVLKGKWFWTALADVLTEGFFSWPTDLAVAATFTDWLKDDVNAPNGGRAENGVVVGEYKTPGNIHWDDAPIERKGRFICEMPPDCLTFYKNVL